MMDRRHEELDVATSEIDEARLDGAKLAQRLPAVLEVVYLPNGGL
jgi:hypothetical protein